MSEFTAVITAILDFCYSGVLVGDIDMITGKRVLLSAQIYIAADKYNIAGMQDAVRPALLQDLEYCEEALGLLRGYDAVERETVYFSHSFTALCSTVHLLLEQSHGEDKVRTRLLGIDWSSIAVGTSRVQWIQFLRNHPEYAADVIAFQTQADWQAKLPPIDEEVYDVEAAQDDGSHDEAWQQVDQ